MGTPSQQYITEIFNGIDHVRTKFQEIIKAAEKAAALIIEGGNLLITDDERARAKQDGEVKLLAAGDSAYPMHEEWGGFVAEACDRAGGFRQIKPVYSADLRQGDVVLVGSLGIKIEEQKKHLQQLKEKGAYLILFASEESPLREICDATIGNGLKNGFNSLISIPGRKEAVGPTANFANVIAMWTFTAELTAAFTRHGRMPAFWQALWLNGASKRNDRIGGSFFHEDLTPPPVTETFLGNRFLASLKDSFAGIERANINNLQAAGELAAESYSSGHKIITDIIGHFMSSQLRIPDFPADILTVYENQFDETHLQDTVSAGDLWFHLGYSYYPLREIETVSRRGGKSVCVFTPGPTELGESPPVPVDIKVMDIYIYPYWRYGDSAVEVPGYDINICPSSGVIMGALYWMFIAETLARL